MERDQTHRIVGAGAAAEAAPSNLVPIAGVRRSRQSLWVLAAATIGLAFGYSNIAWQGFGLYVIPLREAYGWTISEVSLAFTILALVVVVASPLAGLALDRFGVRRVV